MGITIINEETNKHFLDDLSESDSESNNNSLIQYIWQSSYQTYQLLKESIAIEAKINILNISKQKINDGAQLFLYTNEGEWSPKECKQVAKFLNSVLNKRNDNDKDDYKLQKMIDGLKYCFKTKQKAIFC